jgi:hypothetical protein
MVGSEGLLQVDRLATLTSQPEAVTSAAEAGAAAGQSALPEAAQQALAAALSAPLPPNIAAAAAASQPYLYQQPTEGPAPSKPDSMPFFWQQLLTASNFGASATAESRGVQQPLGRILPSAPPLMLMLPLSQLVDVVEGLAELQLCPEDWAVADLLDQIWTAAVASSSSSSGSSGSSRSSSSSNGGSLQGDEYEEAAAAAACVSVAELHASAQQRRKQQQRQQQSRSGFGSSKPTKQQQQQARQQAPQQQQQLQLSPQLLDSFDAASGGLWQAAVAGDWPLGELAAAAAAFSPSSSSSGSSSSRQLTIAPSAACLAAAAAVSDFMQAWYAACEVVLPHAEPQALVRMLIAVATLAAEQSCPYGPGVLPAELLQQQGVQFRRAGQQASALGSAAVAKLQGVQQQESGRAAKADPQQARQQQQQQHDVLLPPLPPASWIAAAVQRLKVTRSAYSEVALVRAFEALADLLEHHPDRRQLLAQPQQPQQQQQQQQQQWWWRQKQLEMSPSQLRAAAVPKWPGAQPADALLYSDNDVSDNIDDNFEDDNASDSEYDSGSPDDISVAEAQRWANNWLHPGAAAVDSSSSVAGSVSVLSQLAVLARCLGNELGQMLPPDSMVEAAAAIAR